MLELNTPHDLRGECVHLYKDSNYVFEPIYTPTLVSDVTVQLTGSLRGHRPSQASTVQ